MSVEIVVEHESGVAVASCTGVFGLEETRAAVSKLWRTEGWPGGAVVWDGRGAEFNLSSEDIRKLAQFVKLNQPTPPARIAFVTQTAVGFGLARMFGAYRDEPETAFQVFREIDEAICWARGDVTQLR
jgi:hypothetical protein